jgi:hypothetical protein
MNLHAIPSTRAQIRTPQRQRFHRPPAAAALGANSRSTKEASHA